MIELKKKNIFIIVLLAILILTFSGVIYYSIKKDNDGKEKDYITYINVKELKNKINNKDDFVLVFTQEGCSHCESYYPIINNVSKNFDIKIYDINLTDLNTEEINELNKIASINGTPTTLFFIDGEEQTTLNRINGQTTEEKLVTKLKKLGYINE